jgi:cell wall-associated NlpC family hydrolase
VALVAVGLPVQAVVVSAAEAASKHTVFGARTLKQGVKGRDVRVLQDFLSRAGVGTTVDGRFGPGTRAKVLAWERRRVDATEAQSSASDAGRIRIDGRLTPREARLLREEVERAESGEEPEGAAPATPAAPAAGRKATLAPDGTAVAPAGAPDVVQQIIAAGNQIHDLPYKYGGGHQPAPNRDSGYDCSGSMSYALQGAGLLKDALNSSGFADWGDAGPGQWVTIYANAGHSYMVVAGLRFDTSGRANAGSRWQSSMRSGAGYTVRHPKGL